MASLINRLVKHFSVYPRRLFLMDGIGAFISALSLGVILVQFQSLVGLSTFKLYILASFPLLFLLYDGYSYFSSSKSYRSRMIAIAFLNLAYCVLSMFVIVRYFGELTYLGLFYFVIEIIILFTLIRIEFKTAFRVR